MSIGRWQAAETKTWPLRIADWPFARRIGECGERYPCNFDEWSIDGWRRRDNLWRPHPPLLGLWLADERRADLDDARRQLHAMYLAEDRISGNGTAFLARK